MTLALLWLLAGFASVIIFYLTTYWLYSIPIREITYAEIFFCLILLVSGYFGLAGYLFVGLMFIIYKYAGKQPFK